MSPTPLDAAVPCAGVESADALNEQIRALWTDGRGWPSVPLSAEQRAEYERLCTALRDVERGDVTAAA